MLHNRIRHLSRCFVAPRTVSIPATQNLQVRFFNSKPGPPDQQQDQGYISEDDDRAFESDRRFSNFVLFSGAFVLAIAFFYSNVKSVKRNYSKRNQPPPVSQQTKYTGKADIGGPWMLYDTKGNPVTHKDFAGKYYLIYFGFTYCPDVCPISLIKLHKTLEKVRASSEYNYFDLEAIFVSVDPDRDTNQRIEEYCKIFDEKLIGLTHQRNDHPELFDMLKKFKIHVSKIVLTDEEDKEDRESLQLNAPQVLETMEKLAAKKDEKYTLDHSIIVYLFGPENQFLTYLGSNLDEDSMANIVLDEISMDLKKKLDPTH